MNRGQRIIAAIVCVAVLVGMVYVSLTTDNFSYRTPRDEEVFRSNEDALLLWYTDESLSEYLETEALSFMGEHGVRIRTELVSGVELLEQINNASIYEGEERDGVYPEAPDLYVTSHDNLMKAFYSSLATEIPDASVTIVPSNYPQTAIQAVTCGGRIVAYPFYYETNYLLYNKTFMANIARQRMMDESVEEEFADEDVPGETDKKEVAPIEEVSEDQVREAVSAMEAGVDPMGEESATNDPEVLERLSTMIPQTITDITTFANNYEAPDTVEAVFKWDVSDVFYNYFFVGNYMDVGGINGDDNSIFNVYNQQTIDCMRVYQEMNKFFSIDSKEVTYDSILQDFIEGKLVFTVATTDAIARIEQAKAEGEFEYDYGVAVLPDVNSFLKSRGMSVTDSIVINGYSDKKDMAAVVAHYLAYTRADNLYKKSGKLPCRKYVSFDNEEIANIVAEYEKSVPLPKMVEAADYWVQLEIAFTRVWNGEDPELVLRELSDSIGRQIDEIDFHTPVQETVTVGL
ncbi:MAG TPA: sugar ABC transporter substrate-binding protein [Lachnospiraceae bacterium]|nr:sugar ABC transporter substrate-binding protein [Lachnospiraceae bacterium]